MEEIIGKIFNQKCGDSLLVINKEKVKNKYAYRCQFQKHFYEGIYYKESIIKGGCNNPQIELDEMIGKIFPQNCGDSLLVLNKSKEKCLNNNSYLWECEFQKYPYKILCEKRYILNGGIINPEIERIEFLSKEWKQNCGDTLRIIEKTNIKDNKNHHYLYRCQFQKYFYEGLFQKENIIKGTILNPQIEQVEFIDKIWKQNCGDSLRIIKKSDKKNTIDYPWECEFIKYPCRILAFKRNIKKGIVENPKLPWNNLNGLKLYIKENFKQKPSLEDLKKKLNEDFKETNSKFAISTVGQIITRFNLKDLINYFPEGSQTEREIKNYIQDLLPNEKISNTWKELNNGQEIDIYILSKNLGIEFNGNYWHSEIFKSQNYHQEKSLLAKEKNINLIHIFEYEWNEKQDILQALIKSNLGIFDKKIGASKCKIKELDNKEYQDFCNENHLQGECGAKVKLGLFYKEELIQVMSFGCPRFTDKYEWEIIRECSKLGYFIIGGKDKLWKYFVKKYSPNNCISYCDFSKFNGNSYKRLGFQLKQLNKPGFVWWDEKNNFTFWRNPSKNQEYKEKYYKIYDCGQLVFEWFKEK